MTVMYSQNTERHRVFGFKAADDSSKAALGVDPNDARAGIVLHAACRSEVPSVSRMILVAAEVPMKISLPGLFKINLFPSLCMTTLYIIRQFRNRRAMKNASFKKIK